MNTSKIAGNALFLFILLFSFSCSSTKKQAYSPQDLIVRGRSEEAKEIFSSGDVDFVDSHGDTALHVAAEVNDADMVSFLLEKGAKTTIKNRSGDTPLHVAINNNSLESAKVLSAVGSDIFETDSDGITALELAALKGNAWLDVAVNEKTGKCRGADGETIVHFFVKAQNVLAVQKCIDIGVPLSEKDNAGNIPLYYAWEKPESEDSAAIGARLVLAGSALVRNDLSYFEDAVRAHNMLLRFNDGQTPLHLAAIQGHTGVARCIVHAKSALNVADLLSAQDLSGATALHEAVRYGHLETANVLLDSGANVDALDSIGKTPILLIISGGSQREIYQTLIDHGATVGQKDMYGDSVFHVATMTNVSEDVLPLLLEHGAIVNERNKRGSTPLSLAIENRNKEHVLFYINNGADVNAEDQDGSSPLKKAMADSSMDMLKMLVTEDTVLQSDSQGNSALHIAVESGASIEVIEYLLGIGADVNARNKNGDSALYLAVLKGRRDAGTRFLDENADIFATNTENNSPLREGFAKGEPTLGWLITDKTLDETDGLGNTPLHYAAEWKLDSAVRFLLSKGASVKAKNGNGETPMFSAVKANSPSIIALLAENGGAIDAKSALSRDNLGNTPLHAAVRWDSLDAAKKLISLGLDVDAQNLSGKSALSEACKMAKESIALLLIRSGADVNLADAAGRTVLMDAIAGQNEELVRLLLSNGADVTIQDMNGRNAYHEAALTANTAIISIVREAGGNALVRDSYGNTPFSLVLRADERVVRAVLGDDTSLVDSDGNTVVHVAVENKSSPAFLSSLIKRGYPFSTRNAKGVTPLNIAVTKDLLSLSTVLLENGADPYLDTIDGENPVSIAFKRKDTAVLDAIVKYNAKKSDRQGDTILHYAARSADERTVEHLLSLGALSTSAKNISGETPAQMARRWERPEIASLLE